MPQITVDFLHLAISLGDLPGLLAKAFCALVPFC
jgi:hypothetical protein